jgi:hypothetical protein
MRSTGAGSHSEGMTIAAAAHSIPTGGGVEELRARIAGLVGRRQELRALGATRAALEENRLELAHNQRELGYALISRHLPPHADR